MDEDTRLESFRPIRMRKVSDEVVRVLVDALRGGLYGVGDTLPRERDLAARLEVSRDVVRDAIERLRVEGVLVSRRGRYGGTEIADLSGLSRVQAALLEDGTTANFRDLLELRRIVEPNAAALAAQRANAEQLEELGRLVEALAAAVDAPAAENLAVDQRFHVALARSTGNEAITATVQGLLDEVLMLRSFLPFGRVERHAAVENQRALLDAVATGDPAVAAAEMNRHLAAFETVVLGVVLPTGLVQVD